MLKDKSQIEKVIIESFVKNFNMIKRLDEKINLQELDYEEIYSKVNPWDKQTIKIDDYPAEGKNLDSWIQSAEDRSQRERFLMNDDELEDYKQKLYKIKSALTKHEKGEPLDDFEKKVVRYYKSDKANQKGRISQMAGQKIDNKFMGSYDNTPLKDVIGKYFSIFDNESGEEGELKILDSGSAVKDGSDISVIFNATLNGEDVKLRVYKDMSYGLEYVTRRENGSNIVFYRFKDYPKFLEIASKSIRNIRPETKY